MKPRQIVFAVEAIYQVQSADFHLISPFFSTFQTNLATLVAFRSRESSAGNRLSKHRIDCSLQFRFHIGLR